MSALNAKMRVIVVDDHPLMREALCAAIEDEPDLVVVGSAADGVQAVVVANAVPADVIIMDLFLPRQGGVDAAIAILIARPNARILALTSSADEVLVARQSRPACGYVLKEAGRKELLHAIREVGRGNAYFAPKIAHLVTDEIRALAPAPGADPPEHLTPREREILRMIGRGATNLEIANALKSATAQSATTCSTY
ncbi:MAG: response regulator transcription factor [Anaerolineales bacterium]|nr:response regulator transcription factor [Anaerolineales bacterium]